MREALIKVRGKFYIVREDGFVLTKKGKWSNGFKGLNYYCAVYNSSIRVHRLIAIAFIKNPENKPCVNHINGIKSDNRVENLEWCTHSENMIHSYHTSPLAEQNRKKNSEGKKKLYKDLMEQGLNIPGKLFVRK